jgi:hypothetical protein
MFGEVILHVIHVAGRRMIAQGTDGLSRGSLMDGVLKGEDFLHYVPLHLSALERGGQTLTKWVEDWFDCGDVIKWLKPEDWYLGGHQWNNCIIPRLMTAHWQKLMSKICDLMFTVPVGSDVWDDSQFEPLVVGLCFPLSRNSPWKLKGTPVLDGVERLLRTLPLSDRGWGRSILRKLFKQTRSLDRMPASLVREMLQATR